MTDQNQTNTGSAPEKDEGQAKNPHYRNNHHNHHKNHNSRPRTDKPDDKNSVKAEGEGTETARRETGNGRSDQNKHYDHKSRSGGNHKRNDRNGGRNSQNNRRNNQESRPYDPYETPSRQEIELSELRAQIVLKSADGTVPTVYGAQPTSKPVDQPEPPVADVAETEITASETPAEATEAPTAEAPVEEAPKVEVVGVRFRSAGKMYYFDPHGITAKKGDSAIVETTRGPEFGDVCLPNTMINASETVSPLRPVIRLATPADVAQNAENREKEKKALVICQEKIEKHGLQMKLIDVQYAFDGSKLLFYFAAEGRVDFRELVKDLASVFRTRIELRQIGIRDEAKMLGGIGTCGRPLCCSTFLPDFAQVSIKMAKDQNLSLNSSKISGLCGRLMCCLRFESDVYAEEISKTPANDTLVRTEDGLGVVIGSNPLAGTVRVLLKDQPDTAPKQYHRDAVTVLGKEKRGDEVKNTPES